MVLSGQESRLNKAKVLIKTARFLFENGYYNDCVSRAYYAVYHAIIAILAVKRKIVRDRWDHTVLHRAFLDNLCKGGFPFSKTDSNTVSTLLAERINVDYSLSTLRKKDTEILLTMAEKLVNKIIKELSNAKN